MSAPKPLSPEELADLRQMLAPSLEQLDEATLFEVARCAVRLLADLDRMNEERRSLARHDGVRMALESALVDVANLRAQLAESEQLASDLGHCFRAATADVTALRADRNALAKRVGELAKLARRGHDGHCEASPRWSSLTGRPADGQCRCGSDAHNKAVDRLLGGGS